LAKAGISAIPYLGGPAKELLGYYVVPPLERRRVEWMNSIAERLTQLEREEKGFKLADLQNNQMFLTAVLHATTIALRTHQEEKLQALQNAVVNTAQRIDVEETLQLLFLNTVDALTPLHLKVLKYLNNPSQWFHDKGMIVHDIGKGGIEVQRYPNNQQEAVRVRTPYDGLEMMLYSEISRPWGLLDVILADLFARGLIEVNQSTLEKRTRESVLSSRTTSLGEQLVKYISDWRR
jgi:hypothetical protein